MSSDFNYDIGGLQPQIRNQRFTHVCRVMGIDPGKHTGIGVLDLYRDMTNYVHSAQLATFVPYGLLAATADQEDLAKAMRITVQSVTPVRVPFVVVTEKYIATRTTSMSQDTQALEVIGSMKSILELLDVEYQSFSQYPSDKMSMSDNVMRQLGLTLSKTDDHARDGLRHALIWCTRYIRNKHQLTQKSVPSEAT